MQHRVHSLLHIQQYLHEGNERAQIYKWLCGDMYSHMYCIDTCAH